MKIAISASGNNLDSQLDPRFGRCQYFLVIDPDTSDVEVMPNDSARTSSGAGIQAAQLITNKGVKALITGNIGPNAFQILSAAGIKTMTNATGTVRYVLEQYKNGSLQPAVGATVGTHAGMPGMDSGFGSGRGRGRGPMAGIGAQDLPGQVPLTKEQESLIQEREPEPTEPQLAHNKKRFTDLKNQR
jgi:predicted Fe-Mo cluster-binding NifX family protein